MEDLSKCQLDPRQLSPVSLAFIGDGVFELLVRERLLQKGTLPAHILHQRAVKKVNAVAQATAYEPLLAELNEEEQSILTRGRNATTAKVPRSCTPEQYRKATAIEALFGYLYLKGDLKRVNQLFATVDAAITKAAEQNTERAVPAD